jgi:hypothetical protein
MAQKDHFLWKQPATQVDMAPTFLGIAGEKTALFEPFLLKKEHFTKTGSGQT